MPSTKHLPVEDSSENRHHHHHHHHCCRRSNRRQMTSSTLFPIGRRSYVPTNQFSPSANVTLPRQRVANLFQALKRTESSWLTSTTLKEIFQLQRARTNSAEVIPRRRSVANNVGKHSDDVDVVENFRATEHSFEGCREIQHVAQQSPTVDNIVATKNSSSSINKQSNNNNLMSESDEQDDGHNIGGAKATSSRHQMSAALASPASTLINVLIVVLMTLVASVTCSILCSKTPRLDLIIIVPRSLKLGQLTFRPSPFWPFFVCLMKIIGNLRRFFRNKSVYSNKRAIFEE